MTAIEESKEMGIAEAIDEMFPPLGISLAHDREGEAFTMTHLPVCVCVNSTSGGWRTLTAPTNYGRLALTSFPIGAAINKIKSATLTLPSAPGRPIACLHPTLPRRTHSTNTWSCTKL